MQNIKQNKSGEKDIIYLIPELVNIIGSDDADININKNRKKFIFSTPDKKMENINQIYSLFNSKNTALNNNIRYKIKSPKELNEEWGINLGNFVEFKTRIIPQPKIIFLDININANQSRFRQYNPLIKKEIKNNNSFYLYFEDDKNIIYNNKSIIFKNIKDKIVLKNSNNWEDIEKELRNKDMLNNKQKNTGIIFLNKNNQNKYYKLKQYFINNYPNLITQFVKSETLNNKLQNRRN